MCPHTKKKSVKCKKRKTIFFCLNFELNFSFLVNILSNFKSKSKKNLMKIFGEKKFA